MTTAAPAQDREMGSRAFKEIEPLDEGDAQLVSAAQRCLLASLDHSRAQKIRLQEHGAKEHAPVIELPPTALRVVARLLGLMGERKPLMLVPRDHELTTQEAANMLNVSRPFLIKEIEASRLKCHMVGSHRRIPYEEVIRYRDALRSDQESALQALADESQELGMGYN